MSLLLPLKFAVNVVVADAQFTEDIQLEPLLSQPSNNDLYHLKSQQTHKNCRAPSSAELHSMYVRSKKLRLLMALRSSRTCCVEAAKWIPVIFILSVVAWSYYAYVVQMCFLTVDSIPKKVIYLLIYHPLLFLFMWSYYRTMFKPIAGPPPDFYISDTEAEHIASAQTLDDRRNILIRIARTANLPLLTRHFDGSIRYCFNCRCIKPDRAHHCSDSSSSTPGATSAGKFHLLFLFFASIMFAISVSSLFFYHLYLIGKNRTTLESFRAPIFIDGPNKDGFNLGVKQNFIEIFGSSPFLAFLPVTTTLGDGVHYRVNSALLGGLHNQVEQRKAQSNTFNRSSDVLIPLDSSTSNTDDRGNFTSSNYTNNSDYLLSR
ncbi:unnamed protein product [Didymodactylos carnosus]|uniref:Protein S-acyltransferase n=1 Tax=Didymodactylos carnosus TaxID=1234261 RepID=A0A8S2EFM5_9BILA|nr:unnamed protein product [Didymodactylos carnosus]CAF3926774.1 unnamed protein product [Didymodactylos carnosus]